ncbi:hypothetical protein V8C86DRAFT_2519244 [Haematococcus lacustris]
MAKPEEQIKEVQNEIDAIKALPMDHPHKPRLSDLDNLLISLLRQRVLILEKEAEARRSAASASVVPGKKEVACRLVAMGLLSFLPIVAQVVTGGSVDKGMLIALTPCIVVMVMMSGLLVLKDARKRQWLYQLLSGFQSG